MKETKLKYCTNCGKIIDEGWKYCSFCGTPISHNESSCIDIDGNSYGSIKIGNHIWMAENLKVTRYRNGDSIPTSNSDSEWSGFSTGASAIYMNEPANSLTYGNLYNWFAVDDNRGINPEGWHVPTKEEWIELVIFLGMGFDDAHSIGLKGTNEGSKLAGTADLWESGDLKNNGEFGSSAFAALPGGYRNADWGTYFNVGGYASFWSLTAGVSYGAFALELGHKHSKISLQMSNKRNGFSVRCIKDYK